MRLARWIIAGSIPLLLVTANVRLVMSPLWLQVEYTRPGFPADPFGFTTSDRLTFGRSAVDYLVFQQDIAALGSLRFEDGRPLFNERELVHMRDVQILTTWAFALAIFSGFLNLAAVGWLTRRGDWQIARRGLKHGGLLTIALLVIIVTLAILGWEFFFTGFHQLFFADGTWYFLTSDTLIRLFPEQFWFDSALAIGGLTILEALVLIGVATRRGKPA